MDAFVNSQQMKDKRRMLMIGVAAQGVLVFCFSISAFSVASTANAGFNVVLTALLYIAFVGGSYHLVKKFNSPLAVGFLIGVSGMMSVLSLMTAVYWGQLSKCEVVKDDISQYSCSQRAGYGAVSAFASLLFIIQCVFFGALIAWRGEIIEDEGSGGMSIGGSFGDLRPFSESGKYDIVSSNSQHTYGHTHNPTTVDL